MHTDRLGIAVYNKEDIVDLLYQGKVENLDEILVEDCPEIVEFNSWTKELGGSELKIYSPLDIPISEFDQILSNDWHMPEDYKNMDIAKWILDQCENQDQLQRIGAELLAFQHRNMMDLLRWLKYFVDTCRKEKIVWGVGRGSSVASYVLYKIGVHKIDSIKYNLDWREFLR
jgi:DNA polymerase III alpha subunit